MALIICPECKKEISSRAISCPNCGLPLKSKVVEWNIEQENNTEQKKSEFLDSLGEKIPSRKSKIRNAKKKGSNLGCFVAFSIFLILAIIVIVNSSDNNDHSSKTTSETISKYTSNSPSITIKYSKVSLNVRKRPNEKSKVLKVLKPNEKVTTKCEQKNGFTQILSSSNQNYGWCSTKYLQDSPLSESQLEEIELRKIENRKIDYRIIEKKDIGLNRFNCKIEIQVDKIPNKDELQKLALKIWGNGYKHWDEFNLWMYLPDMDTNFSAYCFFEFSRNGLNNFEYFSKRKSGEKIYTQNELKTEIKTPDTIIISNTGKKYIELTKNNVNIKLSPDNNSLTIANGFKGDIFSLDSIQSDWYVIFLVMGEYRYVNIEEAKIIDTLPHLINFSYIRRKTVIDLLKAEDRADNEAQIMFPQDIDKQVEYVYILSDKYQLEVLQNNSIPTPYYNKLVLEGVKKEWHRLKY